MSSVISNTGPLIALGGIDRLDILRQLFQTVIVPDVVHHEIMEGGTYFVGLSAYKKAEWIQVQELDKPLDPLLVNTLDVGEASVIHLALQLQVPEVLMDEKKGRKIAREIYNLRIMGTVKVLLAAKRRNMIASVGDSLEAIQASGYWFHHEIIQRARQIAGED